MLPPSRWQGRMSHQRSRKHFVDLHEIFEGYIAHTNHTSHLFSACDELGSWKCFHKTYFLAITKLSHERNLL